MHPLNKARELAAAISSDPVAARQIIEHISTDRLRYLLDLPEASPDIRDFTTSELVDEIMARRDDDEVEFNIRVKH